MSEAWPWKPPEGWWIITREFGRQKRLPAAPAVSSNAPMLAAGDAGKRFCLPNSRVMIHQPSGGFQGQVSDIEIHAKEILYLKARLNDILAKHTGKTVEAISRDSDRDFFMGAEDAVKYGLVDKVLTARENT